jgi:nitroimidazol reductase NimA-like FMN-containing flavoprotein (pyridoxamine 5'-phosphate oxidase superfamily)/ribosomal protein S18 acetylase RimI-like enzyme
MRKESYFRTPRDAALALLGRARTVRLATSRPDGTPVLRAMHAVLRDGELFFHGSPVGEKTDCVGRAAVAQADELVCDVPSWFLDPERGCPAATFYRSAQAHGTLVEVVDRAEKARVLQAFMEKYQPEGRHAPVDDGPRYRDAVDATLVLRMPLVQVDGKDKLGQNRRPAELTRILEQLWIRGAPSDAAAIDAIRDANPALPDPAFLASPQGVRLRCAMGEEDADEVAALLRGASWLAGAPPDVVVRAHLRSSAWIGARGPEGELAASVRALSDGELAVVSDLVVAPEWRSLGLAKALLKLLLDHPAVRPARELRIHAREAHELFERFGFLVASFRRRRADPLEMVLERDRPAADAPADGPRET